MAPAHRNRVACLLGYNTVQQPAVFGNPHKEAHLILTKSVNGMQACCNKATETLNPLSWNSNWHDMLVRCGEAGLRIPPLADPAGRSVSAGWCATPRSAEMLALEDDMLSRAALMQRARLSQEQRTALAAAASTDELLQLGAQLRDMNVDDRVAEYVKDSVYLAAYAAQTAAAGASSLALTAAGGVMTGIGGSVGTAVGGVLLSSAVRAACWPSTKRLRVTDCSVIGADSTSAAAVFDDDTLRLLCDSF